MEHKALVKLSQNERYCSKCKKVKNLEEFNEPSMRKVLEAIKNTCQSTPIMCKECADVKKKIMIDLSQHEKYCTGYKSVKDQENFSFNQEWCKECKSKSMKKYYEKNKSHHKLVVRSNHKGEQVKTVCECRRTISLVSFDAHLRTKIHKDMLEIRQQFEK